MPGQKHSVCGCRGSGIFIVSILSFKNTFKMNVMLNLFQHRKVFIFFFHPITVILSTFAMLSVNFAKNRNPLYIRSCHCETAYTVEA